MRLKNLTLSFGSQDIFNDVNIFIDEDEKVGIVGVNGAGKTTFFKIIMGIIEPDHGEIILKNNTRVSFLPQIIDEEVPSMDITVLDFLMLGRPIETLNKQLQDEYEKLASSQDSNAQKKIFNKIDSIQKKLDYWDSYTAESTLLKIISGMNISDSLLDKKINTLSGGQKSKVAFAKLLYSKPELILLDEPTNHLDDETRDYVINFLKNYKGSVFVISHDTDFLNQVTTKTLFVDKRTKNMELHDGNFDRFKFLNAEHEKELQKRLEKQQQEEDKLRSIINKYTNSSGKRKKMAQDREKKLEKLLENKIDVVVPLKKSKIDMVMERESSEIPLRVKNLSFKYDIDSDNNIIDNLSFELRRGEKFLIVGKNGVGKSTLLKLIVGKLFPSCGKIECGSKTDIGYYAQEHELLDNSKNILENFSDVDISMKQLRNVLGRFLFHGDDVFKLVGFLSPGERSRVALAKLSLSKANLLILDEPTNHLDPETKSIIASVFKTFPGTMLIVSHSVDFVDNLGIDRVLELPSGKMNYYQRNVVEYFQNINSINYRKKK